VNHGHYENFPVASLLCPPHLRGPVLAIYRFARTADDIADEGDASPGQRAADLREYASCLDAALTDTPLPRWHSVFEPLAHHAKVHRLPGPLMHDLLSAFLQDCGSPQYTDRAHLLDYCRRSANPIGRLLLHLYGVSDPLALRRSDDICTSLQLINFWQDASLDLPRGRSYFPIQDLRCHGLTLADIAQCRDSAASQAMVADLTRWAEDLMNSGRPLIHQLPGRLGWELRLVIEGGTRIIAKIRRMDHRTLSRRPRLMLRDWPVMLWQAARIRPTQQPIAGPRQ
jgi:hydroxysqualene synthase